MKNIELNIIWASTRFNFRAFIAQSFHMCHVLFSRRHEIMLITLPPYNADKNIELDVNDLDHSSSILLKWLKDNYIKVSTGKSHHLVLGITAKIDDNYIRYNDH